MTDARLEAFMMVVLQDIIERRSPDERAAFAARIAEMARYADEQTSEAKHSASPALADELRGIERFISRYPRLEP